MDLVAGAKRTIVIMEHVTRDGQPRLRRECTLPRTGAAVVDPVITDLAVFDFTGFPMREMHLVEWLTDLPLAELRARTEAAFEVGPAPHPASPSAR